MQEESSSSSSSSCSSSSSEDELGLDSATRRKLNKLNRKIDKTKDPATKAMLEGRLVNFLTAHAAKQAQSDPARAGPGPGSSKTQSAIAQHAAAFNFSKPHASSIIPSATLMTAEEKNRRAHRQQRFAGACEGAGTEKVRPMAGSWLQGSRKL